MTYQPAAAAAAPTTLYTTQSPVVYSTEQFANQSPQVAQYPGYPTMGYTTYPVNGKGESINYNLNRIFCNEIFSDIFKVLHIRIFGHSR